MAGTEKKNKHKGISFKTKELEDGNRTDREGKRNEIREGRETVVTTPRGVE